MAFPKPKPLYTVDQYLALERAAAERHLFLDGEVHAMTGESIQHGFISVNLVVLLSNQLQGTPCGVLTKDTKVRSGPIPSLGTAAAGMFSYPDVLVVCGEPEFHDAFRDVVLNPKVILEVLSESTERFDRGEKFERYHTWNSSLSDYLLVSQESAKIVHYSRQEDGGWRYQFNGGLDAVVRIESIGCELKMADVYRRVSLP